MTENYYQILGVEETVSEQDLKKAYRKLAQEWHPDKHQGKDSLGEAEAKFKAISEAYNTLSDQTKRREYDAVRAGSQGFKFHGAGNPFDIFGHEFFRNLRQEPRTRQEARFVGQTVQASLEISLWEHIFGSERTLELRVDNVCSTCHGKGADKFETCKACRGSGGVQQLLGNMNVSMTCQLCGGTGKAPVESCGTCHGNRVVSEQRILPIQIPPNRQQPLVFKGAGGRGSPGQPDGDLIVGLRVKTPDLAKLSVEEQESLRSLLQKA